MRTTLLPAVGPSQRSAEGETSHSIVAAPTVADRLHASPRQLAQSQQIAAAFGPAIQSQSSAPGLEVQQIQPEAQLAAAATENQTGMPNGMKAAIEALAGMDLSEVRVHRNSAEPAQLNALAYAQGNEIHLAPGQEQHLPHEAWHVVQEKQGRVPVTTQLAGVAINDDAALESEADAMGLAAMAAVQRSALETPARHSSPAIDRPVQRVVAHRGRDLSMPQLNRILHRINLASDDQVAALLSEAQPYDLHYVIAGLLERSDVPHYQRQQVDLEFNAIFTGREAPLVAPVGIQEQQFDAQDGQGFTYGISWTLPTAVGQRSGYIIQHVLLVDHLGATGFFEAWRVVNGAVNEPAGQYDQFTLVGNLPPPQSSGSVRAEAKFIESNEPADWATTLPYANGLHASNRAPVGWAFAAGLVRRFSWNMGSHGRFRVQVDGTQRHNSLTLTEQGWQTVEDFKTGFGGGNPPDQVLSVPEQLALRTLLSQLPQAVKEGGLQILGSGGVKTMSDAERFLEFVQGELQ